MAHHPHRAAVSLLAGLVDQPPVHTSRQNRRRLLFRREIWRRSCPQIIRQPPVHHRQIIHAQILIHPTRARIDNRIQPSLAPEPLQHRQRALRDSGFGLTVSQLQIKAITRVLPHRDDPQQMIHLPVGVLSRVLHVIGNLRDGHVVPRIAKPLVHVPPRNAGADSAKAHRRVEFVEIRLSFPVRRILITADINPEWQIAHAKPHNSLKL